MIYLKEIFDLDSPLVTFMWKIADLVILNVLTLICCIPIITSGAALTSMHYVILRMRRDESYSIVKGFFHSFKTNFKEATVLEVLFLALTLIVVVSLYLVGFVGLSLFAHVKYVFYIIAILFCVTYTWIFVLLSRYDSGILQTIVNAFSIGVTNLGHSFAMVVLAAIPWAIVLSGSKYILLLAFFGASIPAYWQSFFYNKVFEKIEHGDSVTSDDCHDAV